MFDATRFGRAIAAALVLIAAPAYAGKPADEGFTVPPAVSKLLTSVQTLAPNPPVTTPPTASGDFGFSVALSDRYAVVGAPDEQVTSGPGVVAVGVVYIFERHPTAQGIQFRPLQRIVSPPPPIGPPTVDRFGQSVAIFRETIVVGAPGAIGVPGRVLFLVRDPTAMVAPFRPVHVLAPIMVPEIQNAPQAGFGHVVATHGPFVFVGAPDASVAGVASGAVVVFRCDMPRTPTGVQWSCTKQAVVRPIDPANDYDFGFSLAVQLPPGLNDYTLVVGAPRATQCPVGMPPPPCPMPVASGAAYVSIGRDANWPVLRKYVGAQALAGDRFGHSVAHVGPAFAVGASNDNGGFGTVRIFEGPSPTTLLENATLRATGPELMHFGHNVALFNKHIAIGAPGRTVGGVPGRGSAFIFERIAAGNWQQREEVFRDPPASDANFGAGLAVSGDVLLVGEPDGPSGVSTQPGRAYVYSLGRPIARLPNPAGAPGDDRFGDAVTRDGDVLVVGLPGKESGPDAGVGVVQVYLRNANGDFPATPSQTIVPPAGDVRPGLAFGAALSLSSNGAYLAVGAPGALVSGAADAGAVYVYARTTGAYATAFPPARKLVRPGVPTPGDAFGTAVDFAPDGGHVVVGAPGSGVNAGAGGVFVFENTTPPSAAKSLVAKFDSGTSVAPPAGSSIGDKWGSAVATDGTTIVAGATETDSTNGDDGYVTVIGGGGGSYAATDTIDAPADATGAAATEEQSFGASVDVENGLVVVGAPDTDLENDNADTLNTDEGAAYVYVVTSGQAGASTQVTASYGGIGDKFGAAVAVDDGTVAAGAPGTDVPTDTSTSTDQGAVVTYECELEGANQATCDFDQTMYGKDATAGEGIGTSVSLDGEEFVVGAPFADPNGTDAGAIYTAEDLFSSAATAIDDTGFSVGEDALPTTLDVLANDQGALGSGYKSVLGVGAAANGATAVAGGGTGVVYTPSMNYCGSDSFTYTLDGGSVGAVALTVSCVNDAPTQVGTLANRTAAEDEAVSFATAAGFADVDNATLSYSATGLPTGVTIAAGTGAVSGTIGAGASSQSPYTVTITARDAANASATQMFQFTVTPPAPNGNLIFGNGYE